MKKYKYNFSEQTKFEGLVGYGEYNLSYDFAIYVNNTIRILVEAQGIQHYEAIGFFGGEEQFAKQQLHDELKRKYAKEKDLILVEIPYWYTEQEIEIAFDENSEIYKICH